MAAKRTEYEKYTIEAQAVRDYNGALYIPTAIDQLFNPVEVKSSKDMPARPSEYSGYKFKGDGATTSVGGYGAKTAGNLYSVV